MFYKSTLKPNQTKYPVWVNTVKAKHSTSTSLSLNFQSVTSSLRNTLSLHILASSHFLHSMTSVPSVASCSAKLDDQTQPELPTSDPLINEFLLSGMPSPGSHPCLLTVTLVLQEQVQTHLLQDACPGDSWNSGPRIRRPEYSSWLYNLTQVTSALSLIR